MSESIVVNCDCMKYMRRVPDKAFDLAVVDPPYFSGPERRGYYGSRVSKIGVHRDYPISPQWDIPGAEYFEELQRVCRKQYERHSYGQSTEHEQLHSGISFDSGKGKDRDKPAVVLRADCFA